MAVTFSAANPIIRANEGGFQAMPGDKGNYNSLGELVGTNHGIAAPTYESWIGRPPTMADMKAMTSVEADKIKERWYWDFYNIGQLTNQATANQVLDMFINMAPSVVAKVIQRAINSLGGGLKVDGVYGPLTRNALFRADKSNYEALNNALARYRIEAYNRIGGSFVKSWVARAEQFFLDEDRVGKKKVKPIGALVAVCLIAGAAYGLYELK